MPQRLDDMITQNLKKIITYLKMSQQAMKCIFAQNRDWNKIVDML